MDRDLRSCCRRVSLSTPSGSSSCLWLRSNCNEYCCSYRMLPGSLARRSRRRWWDLVRRVLGAGKSSSNYKHKRLTNVAYDAVSYSRNFDDGLRPAPENKEDVVNVRPVITGRVIGDDHQYSKWAVVAKGELM